MPKHIDQGYQNLVQFLYKLFKNVKCILNHAHLDYDHTFW